MFSYLHKISRNNFINLNKTRIHKLDILIQNLYLNKTNIK